MKVKKNTWWKKYINGFREGDISVRLSYLIMGFANLRNGQIIKGLIFLLAEIGFIAYMVHGGSIVYRRTDHSGDTGPGLGHGRKPRHQGPGGRRQLHALHDLRACHDHDHRAVPGLLCGKYKERGGSV